MADPTTRKARHKARISKQRLAKWSIGTILMMATATLVSVPVVLRTVDGVKQTCEATTYAGVVANTTPASINAIKQQAQQYNNALKSHGNQPGKTQNPDSIADYHQQLTIPPSDIIATIQYPRLGIELPIRHDANEQTLATGAGHWQGTSLPIGGKGTHAVITAHRGLADKLMFTNLDQAREGDTFTIKVLGETLTYQVTNITVVEPNDFKWIDTTNNNDLVTLMTCTPYGVNTHRLLVTGTRTTNPTNKEQHTICPTNGTIATGTFACTTIWASTLLLIRHSYNEIHDRRSTVPTPRTHRLQPRTTPTRTNRHTPRHHRQMASRPKRIRTGKNLLLGKNRQPRRTP